MRPSSRARSIGAYIIALVLGLTIPSLLFSAVMTYQWARSENARLQSLALQINDNVAARVQSFIEAEIGLLEALATSPHLDGGDFHRFHDQARAAIAAGGGVVVLSDPSGQQVANTRVPWGMPLPQAPDATAEKALATKAPQVSDLVMSSEAPTINLAVPVIRRGQAVLALTAVLPASRVGAAVENARVAAPFSASLVDRNGRIVARSIESSAYVGKPHPEFAQAGAPAGQWRGTNPQGLAVEGQYRWLPSGWLVTVGVDRAALRASLMRSAMLVGALGLVLLLIGAVAAGFVIPRVLRAQTALVSAASAIAKGSVVEVPRTGIREADEVGAALSSASRRLNEQASALLSANRDLEARIQERTAELERQTLLLRENEALYRLLAENTTDIIVRNRLDGTREYVSPASRHVLGYEPEELVGQTMTSIVHADDRETIDSEFRAVALGEKKRGSAIYRVRHKSGHWVCIEASFRLATSEQHGRRFIIGTLRDVSERQAQADRLRDSEARFRLLADNATDMIVEAELDTTRKYVSPASKEILGYEPEELLGTRPLDSVHPDDVAAYNRVLRRLTSGQTDLAVSRQRYRHKDGAWVWVEATFRLIRNGAGKPTGYVASVRDISERQRQADELQAAKEAAEKALSEAQHANKAKSEFLASMSHEIRTPLNSVLGFTNLLLESSHHDPEVRRKLELIKGSGTALLTVVNDILDFSKIEAGQIDLDPVTFPVLGLVDNVVSIVRGVVAERPLEIQFSIAESVPPLLIGDANRLQQILLNLMNNAVKFTKEGSVVLAVHTEGAADGTTAVRFEVNDTGIGIPKDKIGRLFERFRQVDGSITRRFGGTGLGLAISRQLVRLMGGEIGVESVEGKGSTFWISLTLPVGDPSDLEIGKEDVRSVAPSRAARILLAEDVDINQELARLVLEGAGHSVDVAWNGAEAVDALQRNTYDLVLMDIQMPVMDGMAATKHIRSLQGPARTIPIIGMTANVLPRQIADAIEAGMNDHVGKPFKKEELLGAVDRWVMAQGGPSSREQSAVTVEPAVLKAPAFEELVAAAGRERALGMLERFGDQLKERFADESLAPADPERLAKNAHAAVSMAGMLGFEELSQLCRRVEESARSGGELEPLIQELKTSRDAALDQIARARQA